MGEPPPRMIMIAPVMKRVPTNMWMIEVITERGLLEVSVG